MADLSGLVSCFQADGGELWFMPAYAEIGISHQGKPYENIVIDVATAFKMGAALQDWAKEQLLNGSETRSD